MSNFIRWWDPIWSHPGRCLCHCWGSRIEVVDQFMSGNRLEVVTYIEIFHTHADKGHLLFLCSVTGDSALHSFLCSGEFGCAPACPLGHVVQSSIGRGSRLARVKPWLALYSSDRHPPNGI